MTMPASRHASPIPLASVEPANPPVSEVAFCAWLALAAPGERLVYHRGFLAVDAAGLVSSLSPERQRALRDVAAAALRAAEQGLVHLVQVRLGPHRFAYVALARPKSRRPGAALSARLLEAA
jgi:hypothetical protein